jgi:uncharacterized membrane protein YsdA (DUF1294 family)/cold shock CspA family protein
MVVKFDSERGFGFIRRPGGGEDVFVHVTHVQGEAPLVPGQYVSFEMVEAEKGLAARRVIPSRVELSPVARYLVVALLCLVLISAGALAAEIPMIPVYLVAINLLAFAFYGHDKKLASAEGEAGVPRIPEFVLLLLLALGGFLGSLAGQKVFRHKTVKASFRIQFWALVILQILVAWRCLR